jgi:hypothetical protein
MPKLAVGALLFAGIGAWAQSLGGAGTLRGTVRDASDAPIPAAEVELSHPVSGFARRTATAADGTFAVHGVPPGTYRLRVSTAGFAEHISDLPVRSAVPIDLTVRMELAGQRTQVMVEARGESIVENRTTTADTVDQRLLAALPAFSPGSGLNDAIVMTTPGVAADSNGFFHPLGDHAQVSYVIDGQPVSDQRNKVFATSIPANAIQSMEIISGAPPAEYGDKTSLVINAVTRSGLGQKSHAGILANYGGFGTIGEEATFGSGTARWGNFASFNAERTGRFLDTPEFRPRHDVGNTGTAFDRMDYQPNGRDAFHLNLLAARNWLQVPNTYDQPRQDQRQKVVSFNLAPGFQRTIDAQTLVSVNLFVRRDRVQYYPSRNVFDDSPVTLSQDRSLTNAGARAELARAHGRHNWKTGLSLSHTYLAEEFALGITSPELGATLPPYDLTGGGSPYRFRGKAGIHQTAAYAQDSIRVRDLVLSAGVRFDRYRGLTDGSAAQPRAGFSYLLHATGTVLRAAYTYSMETPANENLVASGSTGAGGLAAILLAGKAEQRPIALGRRHQYDAGIQQAIGRWVLVDVGYFRKYTRNAFDFDALLGTPVTFPIGWAKSKLDGISARISTVDIHGLRIYATMGHANARFFGPENGGIVLNQNLALGAFRMDHDQAYQQNVNLHYRKSKDGWWGTFTWRYDSGLVVGRVRGLEDALGLTAAQQSVIGLYCGSERASLSHQIASCESSDYGAERIRILGPGEVNDDHNPPRTTPRHLFHLGVGTDNLFHAERLRTVVRLTVMNLSNAAALYNFLSPFSGTHWIEPRNYRAQLGWSF